MVITVDVKNMFFDAPKIMAAVDAAKRRNLSRQLSHIRRTARQTLRKRAKPSGSGQAPSVHTADKFATLKNIPFFYDTSTDSGVVGPLKIGHRKSVPNILEFGGTANRRKKRYIDLTKQEAKRGQTKHGRPVRLATAYHKDLDYHRAVIRGRVNYAPRPFMEPTFVKELKGGRVEDTWRDSIVEGVK